MVGGGHLQLRRARLRRRHLARARLCCWVAREARGRHLPALRRQLRLQRAHPRARLLQVRSGLGVQSSGGVQLQTLVLKLEPRRLQGTARILLKLGLFVRHILQLMLQPGTALHNLH